MQTDLNEEFIPTISHIVCMDKFGIIGLDNKMLWHIPDELNYFKETTFNSIVIMGRNTFESIGRLLPNRINIIVSSSIEEQNTDDMYIVNSLDKALDLGYALGLKDLKNIFVIGGSSIYEQSLDYITRAYITVLDTSLYHKFKLYDNDFKRYPYNELLDKGFKVVESNRLYTNQYISKIYRYILEKGGHE